jgi:acetyl-CoA carboxylase biotin carboxyl carrier protein
LFAGFLESGVGVLDIKLVHKLIEILNENDLVEIEVNSLFRKIRVSRGVAASLISYTGVENRASSVPAPAAEEAAAEGKDAGLKRITSPMVGTFYRAPSPDADSYVEEGQFIEKGTVICIIEAMKIMNEIESEHRGTVISIPVSNGEPVEYGQVLMTVKPG